MWVNWLANGAMMIAASKAKSAICALSKETSLEGYGAISSLYSNKVLSDAVSGMTLNSGATVLAKGDEQILGCIRIMEELKTKTAVQAPGKKTFTMQKKWLDKLHREALNEEMEFWYLKFSFHEADQDVYVAVEQDVIMSMVKTMVEDRRNIQKERRRADVENKRRELAESELVAAQAEIALLKAQLDNCNMEEDMFAEAAAL